MDVKKYDVYISRNLQRKRADVMSAGIDPC